MTIARPVARSVSQAVAVSLMGGSFNPLVFHALDDVAGSYVNDVIIGIGNITEARTSTIYLPDDSAPAVWQSFGSTVAGKVYAGGKWWLYGAKPSTNSQIRSFNLADAEFTKSNMTAVLDATGMRGDANGATTLTATAGNATAIANAITDASDDQLTRWFIKRKTGTGTINITVDGGSTWQDVTTEVDSTAGFNECLEDQAALANPQIGIRIVTSADAVYVGNAEAHLGDLKESVRQSSPLFTAGSTTTINATDLSFDDANHADLQGGYYCEFRNAGLDVNNLGGLLGMGVNARLLRNQSSSAMGVDDGPNLAFTPTISLAADDTEFKFAFAYGSSSQRVNADNAWGTATSYDGEYNNTLGKLSVLLHQGMALPPPATMLIRDIRRYDLNYVAAQAKIDELMS